MRLGKPLEHLQAAFRAVATSGEAGEQLTTIGRQLCYFGYLTYDSIVWVRRICEYYPNNIAAYADGLYLKANSIRFITLEANKAAKVNRMSNRFWLSGIFFSIIHGLLKV